MFDQIGLRNVRAHAVTDQGDRQVYMPVAYFLAYRVNVCNDPIPTVFAAKVTWLVCVFAVTAMIVAENNTATGGSGVSEARVALSMLAKSMQYLDNLGCSFARPPYLHLDIVTVGCSESDLLVLSHLCPIS